MEHTVESSGLADRICHSVKTFRTVPASGVFARLTSKRLERAAGSFDRCFCTSFIRPTDWKEAKYAINGSIFLLSLVSCASLMPVEELPVATWHTTFLLGFISAVFDNIPLTKLALEQNGYDWGMLAYAVGFGGSMIWFGSSAGVAISSKFHESRSVFNWIKSGWHVLVAYVIGFFVLLFFMGWKPQTFTKKTDLAGHAQHIEQQAPAPVSFHQ